LQNSITVTLDGFFFQIKICSSNKRCAPKIHALFEAEYFAKLEIQHSAESASGPFTAADGYKRINKTAIVTDLMDYLRKKQASSGSRVAVMRSRSLQAPVVDFCWFVNRVKIKIIHALRAAVTGQQKKPVQINNRQRTIFQRINHAHGERQIRMPHADKSSSLLHHGLSMSVMLLFSLPLWPHTLAPSHCLYGVLSDVKQAPSVGAVASDYRIAEPPLSSLSPVGRRGSDLAGE
jgi:hypothetical protein